MHECVPSIIDNVYYWDRWILVKIPYQSNFISVFDNLKSFLANLFNFLLIYSGLSQFLKRLVLFSILLVKELLVDLYNIRFSSNIVIPIILSNRSANGRRAILITLFLILLMVLSTWWRLINEVRFLSMLCGSVIGSIFHYYL